MGTIKLNENNEISTQVNGRWQVVGRVDPLKKVLKVYRNRDKHLMKVWNAYGFATSVIESREWFDSVYITEDYKIDDIHVGHNYYLVPCADLLAIGRPYQAGGYEKQIFISLEDLEEFKQVEAN